MTVPKYGRTVFAHVDQSLTEATEVLARVAVEIRAGRLSSRKRREALWRELAGVVADVETIRLWLDAGAPMVDRAEAASATKEAL